MCAAEIKKQMKWQPSCKKASTKWRHTGIVPHKDVFYKLFEFEKPITKHHIARFLVASNKQRSRRGVVVVKHPILGHSFDTIV